MFNFNYLNTLILQLPVKLRQTKFIAWIEVLTKLVADMLNNFKTYRTIKLFFLQHNSQVMYLEHILNDRFNNAGTEIYIEGGSDQVKKYLYNKSEVKTPLYIYNKAEVGYTPTYIYNKKEQIPAVGFIIWVPDTLIFDENEMRALVNRLKLAGKMYTIKYYTL